MLMVVHTKPILLQTDKSLSMLQKKIQQPFSPPQIEKITAHLSASVLADIVSGPSCVPGGPLWSRNSSEAHQFDNDYPASTKKAGGPSSLSSVTHHSPSSHLSSSRSVPTSSHSPCQTGSRRSREAKLIACLSELEQDSRHSS